MATPHNSQAPLRRLRHGICVAVGRMRAKPLGGIYSEFPQKHGFDHRQGSGYISQQKLSTADVFDLMDDLTLAMPWLGQCVNKIDVTNIGQQHDLIDLVRTEPLRLDDDLLLDNPPK